VVVVLLSVPAGAVEVVLPSGAGVTGTLGTVLCWRSLGAASSGALGGFGRSASSGAKATVSSWFWPSLMPVTSSVTTSGLSSLGSSHTATWTTPGFPSHSSSPST
jgi:hypothetical protein